MFFFALSASSLGVEDVFIFTLSHFLSFAWTWLVLAHLFAIAILVLCSISVTYLQVVSAMSQMSWSSIAFAQSLQRIFIVFVLKSLSHRLIRTEYKFKVETMLHQTRKVLNRTSNNFFLKKIKISKFCVALKTIWIYGTLTNIKLR